MRLHVSNLYVSRQVSCQKELMPLTELRDLSLDVCNVDIRHFGTGPHRRGIYHGILSFFFDGLWRLNLSRQVLICVVALIQSAPRCYIETCFKLINEILLGTMNIRFIRMCLLTPLVGFLVLCICDYFIKFKVELL